MAILSELKGTELAAVLNAWEFWGLSHQIPPKTDWLIWILLGGRGAGKTRAGAEWVRAQVKQGGKRRIAFVAPSFQDAREVMIEGESGLLNIGLQSERPKYISSRHRLEWPNGAVGLLFSAEDPNGLRGPQFDLAWADEYCAWANPADTLSNLRLGLRLGDAPQLMITTTPRPLPSLTKLMEETGVCVTQASTQANAAHLSPAFIKSIYDIYGGTRLGRQELNGEILQDHPGALWTRKLLESVAIDKCPLELDKTVIAIDPPVTSGENADACGIIVAARHGQGSLARLYILHDGTVQGLSPDKWAALAVRLWREWDADYILAEVNQGGEMIKSILAAIDADVPVRTVYASKSKSARAEPVAVLYEAGKVKHVGRFAALEDELCTLGAHAVSRTAGKSPDRADALVWAATDLMLKPRPRPCVRKL